MLAKEENIFNIVTAIKLKLTLSLCRLNLTLALKLIIITWYFSSTDSKLQDISALSFK